MKVWPVALALCLFFAAQLAKAQSGVPDVKPRLFYTGYYVKEGRPPAPESTMVMEVRMLADANGATVYCSMVSMTVRLVYGYFRIPLSDACDDAIAANKDVFVQLTLKGANNEPDVTLPAAKVGVVPFALEATHAARADVADRAGGALSTSISGLQGQVISLETEVALLGGLVTGADGGLTRLQTLETRVAALEAKVRGADGGLNRVETLESKVAAFEAQLRGADGGFNRVETLQAEVDALKGVIAAPAPVGAVMAFALSSCPNGWAPYAPADGRYVVGVTGGGTAGQTVGTALTATENRATGGHTHVINVTDPGHGHAVGQTAHTHTATQPDHTHGVPVFARQFATGPTFADDVNGSGSQSDETRGVTGGAPQITVGGANANITLANSTAGITVTAANAGTVAGTNAPYVQLLYCVKQ